MKNTNGRVTVVQEITTAIKVGRDHYLLKTTQDGRGVRIENKTDSLFIPFGVAGKTILDNLSKQVNAGSSRKRRRTKAEIIAQGGAK